MEVLKIQFSPVVGDEKIDYKFNGKKIQVDGKIYDLSSVQADKRYLTEYPIVEVWRGDELEVTLIQYHAVDADEDERYPKPFVAEDSELDDLEVVELEEISEEKTGENPPSDLEVLELQVEALTEKNQMYEQAIMEMAMMVYK